MKFLKNFIAVLGVCLFSSITPVTQGFIIGSKGVKSRKLLIQRIHEPQWEIGYRYGVECKPEERQNSKALQEAITTALKVWLKPIKDLKPARPIVDKFIYKLEADFNPDQPDDREGWKQLDLRVTFRCEPGTSHALIGLLFQPAIVMHRGTEVTPAMISTLNHEIGHAFGLPDTYAQPGIMRSRGGLQWTAHTQPASVMAGMYGNDRSTLKEDDVRGIVWYYKYFYQDQAIDDCFFADYASYIIEDNRYGCTPKHPLIFEAKHNDSIYAVQLLEDDPNIDINAQDVGGMTALHYAATQEKVDVVKALLAREEINLNAQDVGGMTALHYAASQEKVDVVKVLLAREDIKPFLRNKQGRSALGLARERGLEKIIALLLSHPLTLSIDVKDKLTTTWGALKQAN